MESRFTGSDSSAQYHQMQRELFKALGEQMPSRGRQEDRAELQRGDGEAMAEKASSNQFLDDFLRAGGIDDEADYRRFQSSGTDAGRGFEIFKKVGGESIARTMLTDAGGRSPDKHTQKDKWAIFSKFAEDRFDGKDGLSTKYLEGRWSDERLLATIEANRDPRHGAHLAEKLSGGLSYDRHGDRLLGLIHSASTSVDVGMFSLEQPTIMAALHERAGDLAPGSRIRLNSPFALGQAMGLKAIRAMGYAVGVAPKDTVTDHFKVFGADLADADFEKRIFALGSVNVTQAAIGRGVDRFGGRWGDKGNNVESLFVLHKSLVARGEMSAQVFEQLTTQAGLAMDWVASGETSSNKFLITGGESGKKTGSGSSSKSGIFTGAAILEKHNKLLDRLARVGGEAVITTYNVDAGADHDMLLSKVREALRGGAKVTIYTGARWDVEGGFQGMKGRGHGLPGDKLDTFVDSLSDDEKARFTHAENHQQLVHAKTSMFAFGDGEYVSFHTTNNWDEDQARGMAGPDKDYTGPIRNMAMAIHGNNVGGARGNAAQREAFELSKRMARVGAYYKGVPGGYKSIADAGLDGDAWKLAGFRMTNVGQRATIGGRIEIGRPGERVMVDAGNLMTLTATMRDPGFSDLGTSGMMLPGQVYIPELSKFIGSVQGISEGSSRAELTALSAPKTFGAQDVIRSTVAAIQAEFEEELRIQGERHGGRAVMLRLLDPFERGRLRHQVKERTKERFKNYGGWEPGRLAYLSKDHARMMMPMDADGNLRVTDDFLVDANRIDAAMRGELTGRRAAEKFLKLTGWDFLFSAGGLSRFDQRGDASIARSYDMGMFKTMPVSAAFGAEGDEQRYMFLMAAGKLEQLPQRLQNLMSARNLDPMDVLYGENNDDLFGRSRFVGQDGVAQRGVKFRGFMVNGMTGDNAFLVAERFRGQFFGDANKRLSMKLSMRFVKEDSLVQFEDAVEKLLADSDALVASDPTAKRLAVRLKGGQVRITAAGLETLRVGDKHVLPMADVYIGDSNATHRARIDLGTGDMPGSELTLDMRALSLQRGAGTTEFSVPAVFARELTSGDRSVLGGKNPHVMMSEQSRLLTEMQAISRDVSSRMGGVDVHGRMGMDTANIITSSGNLKTGDVFIQTGLHLIENGLAGDLLDGINLDKLLGKRTFGGGDKGVNFGALLDKLAPLMDAGALEDVKRLLGDNNEMMTARGLKQLFAETRAHLATGSDVSMGKHGQHTAAASLAFGVHAIAFMDAFDADPEFRKRLNGILGAGKGVESLDAQQLLGILPVYYVSGISATNTPMSTRARVNFLNYHSGGYTDAFMDMMAMDPKLKAKQKGFHELLTGGLLGIGGADEVVRPFGYTDGDRVGMMDYSPLAHFVPGFTAEFAELTRITRQLQGHGQKPGKAPLTVQQIERKTKRARDLIRTIQSGTYDESGNLTRQGLSGHGAVSTGEGSVESGYIQDVLTIQQKAGVGARTILIPKMGYVDPQTGVFVVDPMSAHSTPQFIQTRLLSADGIKSLGSFDDYSHDIQRLQVEVERGLGVLRKLQISNGRAISMMTPSEIEAYKKLIENAGELEMAQRTAAASGMQKLLGGQLAMSGRNMVAGTLPDLEAGVMLIGSEPWAQMKGEATKEIMRGVRRSVREFFGDTGKLSHEQVAEGVSRLIESFGADPAHAAFSHLADAMAGEYGDAKNALFESTLKLRAFGESFGVSDTSLKGMQARRTELNNTISFMKGLGLDTNATVAQRDQLVGMLKDHGRLTDAVATAGKAGQVHLEAAIGAMLDDPTMRNELMRGMFQRAGAPMGPIGMLVQTFMTVDEYNKRNGAILLDKDMNRRSMFISTGAMAFNLGDYDGDTASVALLAKFAELNVMKRMGAQMKAEERLVLGEVDRQLKFSQEEVHVRFARYYTGFDIFSDRNLYGGGEDARDALHALREDAKAGRLTPGGVDEARLAAFNERVAKLDRLARNANRYVSDLYEQSNKTLGYIQEQMLLDPTTTEQAAYDKYFKSKAGGTAFEAFGKSLKSLTDSARVEGVDAKREFTGEGFTGQELLTFFVMTAYASTQLIGKTFEIQHTTQAVIDAQRARVTHEAVEGARGLLGDDALRSGEGNRRLPGRQVVSLLREIHEGAGPYTNETRSQAQEILGRYDRAIEGHGDMSGMVLVAQQIAREAIKPPKGGNLIAEIRGMLASTGDAYASGLALANRSDRAQGLNAYYQLVEGRDMVSGANVHAAGWGDGAWVEGGEVTDSNRGTWAENKLQKMFTDYYTTQVDDLFAAKLGDQAFMAALVEKDEGGGAKLFEGNAELASALGVDEAALHGMKPDELQKQRIRAYMLDQVQIRVLHLLANQHEVTHHRQQRNDYMRAVGSENEADWMRTASAIADPMVKLQIIAASSSRGKFVSEVALSRALTDVLGEHNFASAEAVYDAASTVSDAAGNTFAEQMASIYTAMHSDGANIQTAMLRAASQATYNEATRLENNKRELAEADPAERAEILERHAAREASVSGLEQIMADMGRIHGMRHDMEAGRVQDVGKVALYMAEQHAEKMNQGKYQGSSGVLANVLLPALLSHKVTGGAFSVAGSQVTSGDGEAMMATIGEFTGMAIGMATPRAMVEAITRMDKTREGVVRAGIAGIALGAGIAAGNYAGKAAAQGAINAGQHAYRGLAGLVGAATGGFLAGGLGGMVLEALAVKVGWLAKHNPISAVIQETVGLDKLFAPDSESYDRSLDETMGDGGDIHEIAYATDANGDIVDTPFHIIHNATDDSDAATAGPGDYEGDLDTQVSAGAFERSGLDAGGAGVEWAGGESTTRAQAVSHAWDHYGGEQV